MSQITLLKKTSVALVDRQLIFRQGLECLLQKSEHVTLVGSFAAPTDVPDCFTRGQVDVLVFELDFESGDSLRSIKEWSTAYPKVDLLVLSALDEGVYGERCIRAGAKGYLSKAQSFEALLGAFASLSKNKLAVSPHLEGLLLSRYSGLRDQERAPEIGQLSDRELLVLTLVGKGQTNIAIAKSMGVSPKTVGSYKERIKEKLNIRDAIHLAQFASRVVGKVKVTYTENAVNLRR